MASGLVQGRQLTSLDDPLPNSSYTTPCTFQLEFLFEHVLLLLIHRNGTQEEDFLIPILLASDGRGLVRIQ